MTVCVAIRVYDCVVFAADSAISYVDKDAAGNPFVSRLYNHGDKVFNLIRGLPVCGMFSGAAHIGSASISTITKDLRKLFADKDSAFYVDPKAYTIKDISEKLRQYVVDHRLAGVADITGFTTNFWIGGYSFGSESSEIRRCDFVSGACAAPIIIMTGDNYGWSITGQPEVASRLLLGYTMDLPAMLRARGIDDSIITSLITSLQTSPASQFVWPAMPTIDAIDLAKYVVEATKDFTRFNAGANTVGGDIDLAVVTKHEGFKWISRKHYYKPELNRETDHDR